MTPLDLKKLQLAKLRREDQAKLRYAFDGNVPDSRPTEAQNAVLTDNELFIHWIVCSNRCLVEGTQVATPQGPRAIETLQPGDTVLDRHGNPTRVVQVFDQGLQEVGDLVARGAVTWASSTANHVWAVKTRGNKPEQAASELTADALVHRTRIPRLTLGPVHNPTAYALGALLGDGCSRQDGRHLWISSSSAAVPEKVSGLLGGALRKAHPNNYSWSLSEAQRPAHYAEWCHGRYAHEKTADLAVLRTWDRASLLAFVAGVFDTDGSLTVGPDSITMRWTMQAKPVLQAVEYACLALWGTQVIWKVDNRAKYKHGPCYNLVVRNPHDVQAALPELTEHLVTPHKQWRPEYAALGGSRSSASHVKLTWGANRRLARTWDIEVAAPDHLFLLANGLVTHNSGKTQCGARIVSWWFMENHPYDTRPDHWKGPLQILVVGRLGEQIDSEIWNQKIKPLLPGGSYKESRMGGVLQRVTNTRNGNRIIFMSHHDALNAREKVQAFTAHIVWLDEMPDHAGLVTELMMRVLTTQGRMYATFTPLLANQEIYRLVTTPHPHARTHKFLMLDNPIFKGREDEVASQVRAMCTSEAEYRARMFGEWWEGDTRATRYNPDVHRVALPAAYHTQWRHVAMLDPAASGLAGLTVWAEDPAVGTWYCVKSQYLKGTAAYDLLDSVEAELVGLRLEARWCDCNPAGFYKEAARRGVPWRAYTEKNDRKSLTLDAFNARLLEGKLKLTPGADLLGDELLRVEWAPGGTKLTNASSFHLLDTARYFADVMPPFKPGLFIVKTQSQELRAAWQEHKARHAAKAAKVRARVIERRPQWNRKWLR